MVYIVWFGLCVWVGIAANNKGRNGFGWFVLAFLFSPLLMGIILACNKDLSVAEDITRGKMEHQHLKDRVVENEKLTDYRLNRVELDVNQMQGKYLDSAQPNKLLSDGSKSCPACAEVIKVAAIKCKHCGIMLDDMKIVECPYCSESVLASDTNCRHCKSKLNNQTEIEQQICIAKP